MYLSGTLTPLRNAVVDMVRSEWRVFIFLGYQDQKIIRK
jgi:hypothetical protein